MLRSKTPDGVLQEIYGHLCTHYAIRSLIGTVAHEFDEDPLKFSFKGTLGAARRSLARRPFSPPQLLADAFVVFCQEILYELLPPRRHRNVARVGKRKMSKWPVKKVVKPK